MSVVEFEVLFDGNVGGVESHRLSLSAFKDSLPKLLDAIRQAGERAAVADPHSFRGGRIGPVGRSLDLQIEEIGGGSLRLKFVVSLIGAVGTVGAAAEINTLPQRAVAALVREIDQEVKNPGGSGNKKVQEYLDALPGALSTQSYNAVVDGEVVATTTITRDDLVMRERAVPSMRTVNGRVSSVTFTRGKERVTLVSDGGEKYICHATRDMVDLALLFRDEVVVATIVFDPDNRNLKNLVMLRGLHQPDQPMTADERWDHIRTKWGGVLKRLAE